MQARRVNLPAAAVYSLTMLLATGAAASAQSHITDLGTLGGRSSSAIAVNDAGQVVGSSSIDPASGIFHATLWIDGVPRDLGTLCGETCSFNGSSSASDINEVGQVVGNSTIAFNLTRGFIWEEGTGMRELRPLDGDIASVAFGINNWGDAVGNSRRSVNSADIRAVIWTADGTPHELAGWTSGSAFDVNDQGQIVGSSSDGALQWENGVITYLGGLPAPCPGAYWGSFGINGFGHVVGVADVSCSGPRHAVKWVNYSIQDLGTVIRGNSIARSNDSINDAGDVVGTSVHPTGCPFVVPRATLWKNGAIVDLGTLSGSPCGQSGAEGINSSGIVVGTSDGRAALFEVTPDLAHGAFGGTPRAIPGRIEAEDYDVGGQSVGYVDRTRGNEGGAYRAGDVDIKPSQEGGYAVGWFMAGEWLSYAVDVQADGFYTITARVGSALPGRTFHVEVDGQDVTGPIAVAQLGDWDQYEIVSVAGVQLRAGPQTLRVAMGPDDYMDFQGLIIERAPEQTTAVSSASR